MSYRIEFLDIATEELNDAFDWYETKLQGLGKEFVKALDEVLTQVE